MWGGEVIKNTNHDSARLTKDGFQRFTTYRLSRKFRSAENFGPGPIFSENSGPVGPILSEKKGPCSEKRSGDLFHTSTWLISVCE